MTCWQAMNKLENMGYTFIKDSESLKAAIIGKAPPEASALLDIVRADREAAADYIRQRDAGDMAERSRSVQKERRRGKGI